MSEDYADETLKTIVSWGRYGEAVVLGVDGISDFEALCSRKHDAEVQLYASTFARSTAKTSADCR
jgi:hypothetical protein